MAQTLKLQKGFGKIGGKSIIAEADESEGETLPDVDNAGAPETTEPERPE